MIEEFEILINTEESSLSGSNINVRYVKGVRTGTFSLSTVAYAVDDLLTQIHKAQPDLAILQKAGSVLFTELFKGSILSAWREAFALARQLHNVLRLRIYSELPSLISIPWEYLYDDEQNSWLALHPEISLVRAMPLPSGEPLPVTEKLRVLVMISSPNDLPTLDVAQEWSQLEQVANIANIELTRIAPTYAALMEALRQHPHIFHFIGHGKFDEATQQGVLYLCDDADASVTLPADKLANLLGRHSTLRLALLNACQGATLASTSAFAGVAQRLIQAELPAVIAMQAPIVDQHGILFSHEFYKALVRGMTIESAMVQGRKRINEVACTWGIPSLYLQTGEIQIPTWYASLPLQQKFIFAIKQFLVSNTWTFGAILLSEIALFLLFIMYRDTFLIPWSIFLIFSILIVLPIWCIRIANSLTKVSRTKTSFIAFVPTIAYLFLIISCLAPIVSPSPIPPEKFGIAIALFNAGTSYRATILSYDIQDRLYDDLLQTLDNSEYLSNTVELRKIGIVSSEKQGVLSARNLMADLVVWGKIFENEEGIKIFFQIFETELIADNPAFPRAIPMRSPSAEICIGVNNTGPNVDRAAKLHTLGLTNFSLGLVYYLEQMNPKLAAQHFRDALQSLKSAEKTPDFSLCDDKDSNLSLIHYYLGKSYQLQGLYEDSLRELNFADNSNLYDSAILLGQAYNYRALDRETEAQRAIESILQHSPGTEFSSIFNRAIAYELRSDYEDALIEYQEAISIQPDSFVAHLGAGRNLASLGQYNNALEQLSFASNYTSGNSLRIAWLELERGELFVKTNNITVAVESFTKAIAASPEFVMPYLRRAELYARQRSLESAASDFEKVVNKTKVTSENPGWAYAVYGDFLYNSGEYNKAITKYKEALRYPLLNASTLRGRLAYAFSETGNMTDAYRQIETALDRPEKNEAYLLELYGHILTKEGKIAEAIEKFENSIHYSTDIDSISRVKLNLGQLYTSVGNTDRAISLYNSILILEEGVSEDILELTKQRLQDISQ